MSAIHEVAKRAGVAPITVSRVVNNNGYVSGETRGRVEVAIRELNYIPNALGASLRSKQTKTLALVLPHITDKFFGAIAQGAEDAANRLGYHIILGNTDGSETKLEDYLLFLAKKQVDGFIFVPTSQHIPKFFLKHKIPFVTLDREAIEDQVDSVRADSVGGAFQLTKHLLELGHRHIAVITGPEDHSTAYDRAAGAIQAFKEAGLGDQPQIYWGNHSRAAGYEYTKQALATVPRPTAIFAATDGLLIGTILALREANLRIPEDMSVVAFDDVPYSPLVDPFFTVAIQPTYEMGRQAVELLVARLAKEGPDEFRDIILPVEVIVRNSTSVPAEI
ncbi:MAG: LacI family DNA-binding transcriptional regulator [Anaerolineae bacterium]|nr:LacI family DNA-binding transcriptional regulator [Anaerolineae bacterium]